jgi:hypothetical protein
MLAHLQHGGHCLPTAFCTLPCARCACAPCRCCCRALRRLLPRHISSPLLALLQCNLSLHLIRTLLDVWRPAKSLLGTLWLSCRAMLLLLCWHRCWLHALALVL